MQERLDGLLAVARVRQRKAEARGEGHGREREDGLGGAADGHLRDAVDAVVNRELAAELEVHGQRDVDVVGDDGDAAGEGREVSLLVGLGLEVLADEPREHVGEAVVVGAGGKLDVWLHGQVGTAMGRGEAATVKGAQRWATAGRLARA